MRLLMIAAIAIPVLTLVPSAFAQTDQQSAPSHAQITNDTVEKQHPDWFTEPDSYKPCPANVEFANGRHGCL